MPKLSNQERARAIGLIEGGASYDLVSVRLLIFLPVIIISFSIRL
ncbi:hypothetical protein MAR_012424 [Mya arenaria]|uniref:Uncharacterized protein n=1 Tax=Mya arenaria TaxID=6604 RepID=A0ABY7FX05_MYAAR|nr:hypothetical protein MAR_012424 [Mya arenaria]